MADEKRTHDEQWRKDERAKVEAELLEMLRRKAPQSGDARDQALKMAGRLREAIDDCVWRIRTDDGAAGAADKLHRMERALLRAQTDEDKEPILVTPVLWALRVGLRAAKRRPDKVAVEIARKHAKGGLDDWTELEIRRVLAAANFKVALAHALTRRGYPMTEKNVERLLKKR